MSKNKRGILELGLDFASFATSVEGSCKVSDLSDDIQALGNKKALLKDIIDIHSGIINNQ